MESGIEIKGLKEGQKGDSKTESGYEGGDPPFMALRDKVIPFEPLSKMKGDFDQRL